MPITIRSSVSPDRELDVTHALVAAVAQELWRHGGGNEVLNWMEAERFILALARPDSHDLQTSPTGVRHPGRIRRKPTPMPIEEPLLTSPLPA